MRLIEWVISIHIYLLSKTLTFFTFALKKKNDERIYVKRVFCMVCS